MLNLIAFYVLNLIELYVLNLIELYVLNLVIYLICQTQLLYTFVVLRKHSPSIIILLSALCPGIFGETLDW
jgi:hypothetical protein